MKVTVGTTGLTSHAKVLTGVEVTRPELTALQMSIDSVIGVVRRGVRTPDVIAPGITPRAHVVTIMRRSDLERQPFARRTVSVVDAAVVSSRVVVDPALLNVDLLIVGRQVEEVRGFSLRALGETEDHGDHDHEDANQATHVAPFGRL